MEGRKMVYWILGACLVGTSWASAVLLVFPQTERTDDSFRHVMNESYHLDSKTTDYVPYKYVSTVGSSLRKITVARVFADL